MTRRSLLLAAVLALVFAAPQPARAGTATVYQCSGPGSQPAATDMLSAPAGDPSVSYRASCGSPATTWDLALSANASPGTRWSEGQVRELRADAPSGTLITGGRVERQMLAYRFELANPSTFSFGYGYRLLTAAGAVIEHCAGERAAGGCAAAPDGTHAFATPSAVLPALSTPALRLAVGCFAGSGAFAGNYCYHWASGAGLGVQRLALRLTDGDDPAVRSVAGPLADDPVVRRRELSLNASDVGLGLYRVRLSVDGQLVEQQPYDSGRAACRDVDAGNADPYEFAAAYACPTSSTSRSLAFSKLPSSGEHTVRVVVEDASGNETVALDRTASFELPVDELQCAASGCVSVRPQPSAPNGLAASAQARLSVSGRRTVRAAYGRRVTISGRLLAPGGTPITAALLDVTSQTRRPGAAWRPAAQVRTDARGGYRLVVPAGPSRLVRIGYRARLGDTDPAQTLEVRVEVTAGLRMSVRPGSVRPGGGVKVTGRLLGAGVARGSIVELQARDGREWRTFKTLATASRGRFAYRYRFRHTSGPARFLWRVHVRAQAGLPYAAASSRAAWVIVRR